ncbi:MAG: hypothetical protein HY708_03505 [Ignavibacteriae bacterium]|nr:hypothetical protein [Ignavibacteriota bacterium]
MFSPAENSFPTARPSAIVKKGFALIFLAVYLYNIVGYLAVFGVLQYRVKQEIKQVIKASVPADELIVIAVKEGEEYILDWIEDHEFRLNGKLFDIVRQQVSSDTTYYFCINDVQEEKLFENLDEHVRNHINSHGQQGKSAKDISRDTCKDQFTPPLNSTTAHLECVARLSPKELTYFSRTVDVPTPPPRVV